MDVSGGAGRHLSPTSAIFLPDPAPSVHRGPNPIVSLLKAGFVIHRPLAVPSTAAFRLSKFPAPFELCFPPLVFLNLTRTMSSPQPTEPAPAAETPDPEAELYAASAAENALPSDNKLPDDTLDLSMLSTALSDEDANAEKSASNEDNAVAKVASDEPELTLTKEEMVEEALNCPCIAAMKDGPCGDSFLAAYRCFLESETEPKGMDCMEKFTGMQSCMAKHPEAYNSDDDDDDPFATVSDEKEEEESAHNSEEKREDKAVEVNSEKVPPSPPATAVSP